MTTSVVAYPQAFDTQLDQRAFSPRQFSFAAEI